MRRLLLLVFIATLFISLATNLDFFIVSGPLCGPLCPEKGPKHWRRDCLGFVQRTKAADGFTDRCFGLPVSEKECFGVPKSDEGTMLKRILCPELL